MNLNNFKYFLNDLLEEDKYLICVNAKADSEHVLPDDSGLVKATDDVNDFGFGDTVYVVLKDSFELTDKGYVSKHEVNYIMYQKCCNDE